MAARCRLADGHFLAFSAHGAGSMPVVDTALGLLGVENAPDLTSLVAVRRGRGVSVEQADAVRDPTIDPTAAVGVDGSDLDRWVATVLPPAARAVASASDGRRIDVAVDRRAIGEVYVATGDRWAMVSTSAVLLAAATGAEVDAAAVLRYARLGHFLGDDGPWVGVRRLAPGEVVTLENGRATTRTVRPASPPPVGLAEASVRVLEAAGQRGGVEIELSGGLDSRLVLAACRAAGVTIDRALTLGSPGEPDLVVAAGLAARLHIPHTVVDLADLNRWAGPDLLAMMERGAVDRGWIANPIDTTPLDWVESVRGPGIGVSGQNGEIARGFYYRGPHAWLPSGRRVDALARWRLFANAGVDVALFAPSIRGSLDDDIVTAVANWLDEGSHDLFLRSTDDFYLRHRMTRWVGPAYAGAGRRHPVVAPFFAAGFIAAAGRLTTGERRRSSAVAEAVAELDPELAAVPLANGASPERMATNPSLAAARHGRALAGKAMRKVGQRLGRSAPVAPSGTGAATRALAGRAGELVEILSGDPLLDGGGLSGVPERADARELAFLLSLAGWRRPRQSLEHGILQPGEPG